MALRAALREDGWFSPARPEPNLGELLDLVALGTVADVVPLDANNRILVHQGLARIRAGRCRPGIRALLEVARRPAERLASTDLGFIIGPRLNAAGRLDDMSLGIECLLTDDEQAARDMAGELDSLNRDRKAIEQGMQQQALQMLDSASLQESELPFGLCLFDPQWHQGVIGILASRMKERYHRPVIAFADADNGELKGSARSIPGLHIRDTLDAIAASFPELISKFGGHAMAAGLTINKQHYEAFAEAFDAQVRSQLTADDLTGCIYSDGCLADHEFDMQLAQQLRHAGPWGQRFPEPLFHGDFKILSQRLVGERHLKMVLQSSRSAPPVDAIAFNIDVDVWPNPNILEARVAYTLDVNEFRGNETLQLIVSSLTPL